VVERVRGILGLRRVGHTGTLDPLATGLLPLCIGKATRLSRFLTSSDKTYAGTIRFGIATDTHDREGRPLGPPRPVTHTQAQLRNALAALSGPMDQAQVPRPGRILAGHTDAASAPTLSLGRAAGDS